MKMPPPDGHEEVVETPERNLWMAVVERALKDYCFFFDKLHSSSNGRMMTYRISANDNPSVMFTRTIKELNRLRWFLFCETPEPFNLIYLTELFYEDGAGMAANIREMASRQFRKNMLEAEQMNIFVDVREHISKFTSADKWSPAEEYVQLRHKRYKPH
jgi:hypothetical protein